MKKSALVFSLSTLLFSISPAFAIDERACPSVKKIQANALMLDTVFHKGDQQPDFIFNPEYYDHIVFSSGTLTAKKNKLHLVWFDFQPGFISDDALLQKAQNTALNIDSLYAASEVVVPKEYRMIECTYITKRDLQGWLIARFITTPSSSS